MEDEIPDFIIEQQVEELLDIEAEKQHEQDLKEQLDKEARGE